MPDAQHVENVQHVCQRPCADPLSAHNAAVFALANGLVGIKGAIDELASEPNVILPAAYVTRPITYHEAFPGYADATETRVLCPSPLALGIMIDGAQIDLAKAEIASFTRWLDLDTGTLHRATRWRLADGRAFEITALRIVPLDGGPVIASRLRLMAINFTGEVALVPGFGLGGLVVATDAHDPRISARVTQSWTAGEGAPAGVHRFVSGALCVDYRSQVTPTIGKWREDIAGGAVVGVLAPSDSLAYDRVVDVRMRAHEDPAPLPTFNALAQAQHAAVSRFWRMAQCTVEGDETLTQALRFNQFQLLQSASRDAAFGTAAKGMTGDGYEGHYFWDAEAFMLPALTFTAPDRARTLLGARVHTLDAARVNARLLGHAKGALYPWRTIAGRECSSHYPTGAAQYHINADIACAIKLYADATGDTAFLAEAAEMLFETARIWIDIGRFDPARAGAFCIYGVTGPDEYTAFVDNDFYTNAAARAHLAFAAEVAKAGIQGMAALAERIGLDDAEIATWARAAEAMWLPVDTALGINPQDDSFLAKPAFKATLRVPGRPLLLDHHPMELFRAQVCKQGDVVQALAMGLVDMPATRAAANYAYYEPITSHDSTLSAPAFAVVAARIGAFGDARAFLDEAAFVDLENRHHNTDHGLHMAALAGSWLALARGWAGLTIASDGLHLRPQSAPELPRYTLNLAWRGSVMRLSVGPDGATYTLIEGAPFAIHDHGRPMTVTVEPQTLSRPGVRALIFDLDGVLTDTAEDHFHAWAELARRHALTFDRAMNEQLKGVDRANSLRLILEHSGATMPEELFTACLAEKNEVYKARLAAYTPANLFEGVADLFAAARAAGLKVDLASASRNAPEVLARLGIADQFDFIADAGAIANPKPAPDIFLACAAAMGVAPGACVGIEDAQAGVEAIRAAGMPAIGIDAAGALSGTARSFAHVSQITISDLFAAGAQAPVA